MHEITLVFAESCWHVVCSQGCNLGDSQYQLHLNDAVDRGELHKFAVNPFKENK